MPDTIHLCQAFFSQINPNLLLQELFDVNILNFVNYWCK